MVKMILIEFFLLLLVSSIFNTFKSASGLDHSNILRYLSEDKAFGVCVDEIEDNDVSNLHRYKCVKSGALCQTRQGAIIKCIYRGADSFHYCK